MAKKKRQRRNKAKKRKAANQSPPVVTDAESRGSLMVTVCWMLTVLATLVATFVAYVARLIATKPESTEEIIFVANVLVGVALITGILAIVLTPIAYQLRELKPPRAIVIFAMLIGLLPWLVFARR